MCAEKWRREERREETDREGERRNGMVKRNGRE